MHDVRKSSSTSNEPYQVYALVDPRDKTIRYVGISKDARSRLAQHMSEVENRKRVWLFDLKQQGLQPDIEVLEIVTSDQDVVSLALEREEYWIRNFLDAGAKLTNVARSLHTEEKSSLSNDDEGLTAKEACEYLGVSRRSLERYADAGRITKYRRGIKRTVFFKQSELERLLEINPDLK